jgi:isoleucyl-tRNA synthetase
METNMIQIEENIIKFWTDNDIYNKIVTQNKNGPIYNFIDGPPFVSSDNLHYGHLLVSSIKSATLNYMQMKGYNVKNKIGFDCHGLPIEMLINKILNIENNVDVIKYGIDKYNALCKETINKYALSWKPIYDRIGRFVNYNNIYKTMDLKYMESIWKITKILWEKNFIISSNKIMAVSPKCGTVLSNFEASQNYKDVCDPSIYFKIKIDHNTYIIVWTTTPWTLPSNICLCVNLNIDYVKILDKSNNEYYILGKFALSSLYKDQHSYSIIQEFKGNVLANLKYEPLFNYYVNDSKLNNPFRILCDNYVTTTSGTGIVHLAPVFGEDDCRVCINNKVVTSYDLEELCPISDNGFFIKIDEFIGQYFQDINNTIITKLKNTNMLIKKDMYRHSYPFCWRTDVPLIYKPVSGYFIDVSKIKSNMLNNNINVNWIPESVGNNRFANWISNSVDWCISRSRFFGTPIPIWVSDDFSEKICIGSIDELKELAKLDNNIIINDIHMEHINDIVIISKNGNKLKRIPFVFDCWFESGCVPYAQNNEILENNEYNQNYMGDFICEGIDQTRGWFYTLLVLSTALFNKPPTKNILCSGLILASDGKKMSKKDNNYTKPLDLLKTTSADSIRLYLIGSPAAKADSFKFNQNNIDIISKKIYQLHNCYNFFEENYNKSIDSFSQITDAILLTDNLFDKWIISKLGNLLKTINEYMSVCDINKIPNELLNFIEDFTNIYLKFNRNILKGNCEKHKTNMSINITLFVFLSLCKIMAPFIPFTSEYLYKKIAKLNIYKLKESVHLEYYPVISDFNICYDILEKFNKLQFMVNSIRSIRSKSVTISSNKIPINSLNVYLPPDMINEWLIQFNNIEYLIKNDMNVVNIHFCNISNMVKYIIKPNNKTIGQTYKGLANNFKHELLKIDPVLLYNKKKNDDICISIVLNDNSYIVNQHDYDIDLELDYKLNSDEIFIINNGILLIANTKFTADIECIYLKNVLIRKIQKMRKMSKLKPWNKLNIYYNLFDNCIIQNMINQYVGEIQLLTNCTLINNNDIIQHSIIHKIVVLNHKVDIATEYNNYDNTLLKHKIEIIFTYC